MSNTYKKIELVGTSDESISRAVQNALRKAGESLHNLDWYEVTEIRGRLLDDGKLQHQVSLKVGMRLD